MKSFIALFLIALFIFNSSLEAPIIYNPIENPKNKHHRNTPYWDRTKKHWDQNVYKSYFYYDHEAMPQYTYVYPGHYYYLGYPYYYNHDKGETYGYWGF